ncbi:hypothetical protein QE152_g33497 [Popillia japonica]|uniref:Uncharacterized protein n=1 Tax=Popillia japonica TaxID=7064 RepID=A0AAW1IWP2_POPJA
MFRPNLNFEDTNYRIVCNNTLKKIKNQTQQEQTVYQLKQSSQTSHHLNTCPLSLKPTKLSDTVLHVKQNASVHSKKKRPNRKRSRYKESNCAKVDIDESILTGLQTVIDLCGLLEKYEEKHKQKHRQYKNKKQAYINKDFNYACHNNFDTYIDKTIVCDESAYISKVSRVPDTDNVCELPQSHSRIDKHAFESTTSLLPSEEKIPDRCSYDQSLQVFISSDKKMMQSKPNIGEPNEVHVGGNRSVCHVNYVQESKITNRSSEKLEPSTSLRSHTHSAESTRPGSRKSLLNLPQKSPHDDIDHQCNTSNENSHLKNTTDSKSPSLQSLTNERIENSSSSTHVVKSRINQHNTKTNSNYPMEVSSSKRLSTKYFPPMEIVPELVTNPIARNISTRHELNNI